MSESTSSFMSRTLAATGLRAEQIPDAPPEAMLGGNVSARRGANVLVLIDPCGQDDDGTQHYGRAVLVDRSPDLPAALPAASGVMWAAPYVVDSRAYQLRARVFLAVPQAAWGRCRSEWDGMHPADIEAEIGRHLRTGGKLAVASSNPAILRAVQQAVRDGDLAAADVAILDIAPSGEETRIPLTTNGGFARAWPMGPPR